MFGLYVFISIGLAVLLISSIFSSLMRGRADRDRRLSLRDDPDDSDLIPPRPVPYRGGYVALLVMLIYGIACACPALALNRDDRVETVNGYQALTLGACCFGLGVAAAINGGGAVALGWPISWAANIALFVALIFLLSRRPGWAVGWGTAAFVMSFGVWFPPFGAALIGYYLWVSSMVVLVAGAYWSKVGLAAARSRDYVADDPEAGLSAGW